jgi:hypothetical protein
MVLHEAAEAVQLENNLVFSAEERCCCFDLRLGQVGWPRGRRR